MVLFMFIIVWIGVGSMGLSVTFEECNFKSIKDLKKCDRKNVLAFFALIAMSLIFGPFYTILVQDKRISDLRNDLNRLKEKTDKTIRVELVESEGNSNG